MAASRYRRFLKLCEEWPVDETKRGRDLGAYLRQRVAQAFREGENTQIAEPEACDQMYESLARLHSNYYKLKYPRPRDTSFSGLSLEEYKLILSTGGARRKGPCLDAGCAQRLLQGRSALCTVLVRECSSTPEVICDPT
ncbi:ubiquinol-cytochrome c reductase complex assembly factor 2 isoform X1 [Vicugna pacos]|uniref:Mitochondrial nucleoid factor 1 n=1 Tax=Vicugna pacos TaxID=30538 RepID=A0ABM5BY60_VICPA